MNGLQRFPFRGPVFFLACTMLICVFGIGCHLPDGKSKPSLEITHVPPANPGGPDLLDLIEGHVHGARPGQQIVLYAHSGSWWIQPTTDQPFTKVQPDSTWKNSTHLGTDYAALLVEPGYHPGAKIEKLPGEGNGVVAITVAKGQAGAIPSMSKVIHFSGYDWIVRAAGSDRGGETSAYSPENAWTDSKGYLHLRMGLHDGRWTCAEVNLNRSFGYGSYRFVVQETGHLPPSAVIGMFLMDEGRTTMIDNELDIELSRWARPESKNAQYVVQPYYVPENVARFSAPAGVVTHTFRWEPGKASFASVRGPMVRPETKPIAEHIFTASVPPAGAQTIHMNLYDFHHSQSRLQEPVEVVIEKFEYLP